MSDPNADTFDQLFPVAQFTDEEVVASTRPLERGRYGAGAGVIASVACRRIDTASGFAVAFANRSGERVGPFLLTRRVAAELRKVLEDSAF